MSEPEQPEQQATDGPKAEEAELERQPSEHGIAAGAIDSHSLADARNTQADSAGPAQAFQVFDLTQEDDEEDPQGSDHGDVKTSWWDSNTPLHIGGGPRSDLPEMAMHEEILGFRERVLCEELRRVIGEEIQKASESARLSEADVREKAATTVQQQTEAALQGLAALQEALSASRQEVQQLATQLSELRQQQVCTDSPAMSATASTTASSSSPCKAATLDDQAAVDAHTARRPKTDTGSSDEPCEQSGTCQAASGTTDLMHLASQDHDIDLAELNSVVDLRSALLKAERRAQLTEERRRSARAEATAALRNLELCQSQLATSHCEVLELEDRVEELTDSLRKAASAGRKATAIGSDHCLPLQQSQPPAPQGSGVQHAADDLGSDKLSQQVAVARKLAAAAERSRLTELRDIAKCRGELDKLQEQMDLKVSSCFGSIPSITVG
eukprot:TRINITY_DN8881_c0_g1_i1.p1 TRINITY_DN8881_c0_g1~~TRINITY_DN8881_c0_g1_i1.p1  ORF type:complete len:442 (+),score=114.16 TRINITY_DN8881_c0_g1_i1:98-1423(+)